MAFTTFIDNLALVEVLLLLVGAILAYGGVLAYWAIRTNDPRGLRAALKGMAVPLGGVGAVTMVLAIWGEIAWPFLASDGMAGYNIFFFDVLVLLAIVLLAYAVSAYMNLRLQFVGLLALVAGGVVAFYGYIGYTAHPAFTKDPFDTLLLYAAFAGAGIFAFPATLIVDYYLSATEAMRHPFNSAKHPVFGGLRHLGTRGAEAVSSTHTESPVAEEQATSESYHVPIWAQGLLLVFPVVNGLAAIAALWYFGVTLPGHLGLGPGAAP